jgi:hypothetical protein
MIFRGLAEWASKQIIRYLEQPISGYAPFFAPHPEILRQTLMPGDVLLIEGNTRISMIITYLTQSTWSHAALYVGDALPQADPDAEPRVLLEALPEEGVVAVPLSKYAYFNTRICRPVGLDDDERRRVVKFAVAFLGRRYDIRYVLDLARYLIPIPVPVAMRRRMLALGSGDPTRAICSTMIAQSFGAIRYPILPDTRESIAAHVEGYEVSPYVKNEALHIRREGLFTPRDFDISPYFAVVKPTIESGFDFHRLPPPEPAPQVPEPGSA